MLAFCLLLLGCGAASGAGGGAVPPADVGDAGTLHAPDASGDAPQIASGPIAPHSIGKCGACACDRQCEAGMYCTQPNSQSTCDNTAPTSQSAVDQGYCVGAADYWVDCPGACSSSFGCIQSGLCTATHTPAPACVIGSDADCAQSEGCASSGACHMATADGHQMCSPASDADCANSALCIQKGACHFQPPSSPGNECWPADDADCAKSKVCLQQGQCHMDSNGCSK